MAAGISGVHSPDHILSFLSEHHTHLPDGIPIVYIRHTVFKAGGKSSVMKYTLTSLILI